ncbi:MAG TPA: response regulator [Thermoanaerobaculia bacterium]|nr:response regulator [Thermoanaerobaculia bacterium]
MVVDDSMLNRHTYETFFDREGFETSLFESEADALAFLATHSPHVTIIHFAEDMRRSTDFIARVHAVDATIAIFYITHYSGERVRRRAIDTGAYTVLSPHEVGFFSEEFAASIRRATERSARQKRRRSGSREAFVVMPFAKRFNNIYRLAIQEPLRQLGLTCERADELQSTGNLLTAIYQRLQQADVIIGDMTGKNPNVFYEVGFAHGIGRDVILLTQKLTDIPSDLRLHRHIIYGTDLVKLKDELLKAVMALEAEREDRSLESLSAGALPESLASRHSKQD